MAQNNKEKQPSLIKTMFAVSATGTKPTGILVIVNGSFYFCTSRYKVMLDRVQICLFVVFQTIGHIVLNSSQSVLCPYVSFYSLSAHFSFYSFSECD